MFQVLTKGEKMVLIEDSLSVVLVGDWNKLYIQPDWMAQHIFEKKNLKLA